ncbi:MAG TPA: PEP-CTERM sorting domain-containing protein [bacterium]|nr:PEP-CTERM sorting domain-containing protein [bacterium]
MKTRSCFSLVAVVFLCLFFSNNLYATIQNNSFEVGVLDDWTISGVGTGSKSTEVAPGNGTYSLALTPAGANTVTATTSSFYAYTSGATISGSAYFNSAVAGMGSLNVNFYDAASALVDTQNALNVTWNGWNKYTFETSSSVGTPTQVKYEISFSSNGNTAYWDVVESNYSTAVPEPSSVAMFALGVLGVGIAGYRRMKR